MNTQAKKVLKQVRTAGLALYRDKEHVFLEDGADPDLQAALDEVVDQIANEVVPKVDADQRRQVDHLLADFDVYYVVSDDHAARAVQDALAAAAESGCVAIDTETAVKPEFRQPVPVAINADGAIAKRQPKDGAAGYALNPRKAYVRLVQVYAGSSVAWLFDMERITWSALEPLFNEAPAIAMFNSIFDVKMILASGGPEPTCRIYDTCTAMKLLQPPRGRYHSLADAADFLLRVKLPKELGASDWSGELTGDQQDYAVLDAIVTHGLWEVQQDLIGPEGANVQEIVDECIVPVARMELAGMPVDIEQHRAFIEDWKQELGGARRRLADATGGRLTSPPGAVPTPNQIRAYLAEILTDDRLEDWPRTGKTGQLSASKDAYKTVGVGVPGLAELMEVDQWHKGLTSFGESLLARVEGDRLYGRFNIAAAKTGRFSSSDPNMQQIPRRSKAFRSFRRIFRAPPGYAIMAADYNQIEIRVLAELSEDELMRETFRHYGLVHRDKEVRKAFDVHRNTALNMQPDFEDLDEDEQDRTRSTAKATTFGLIYGSGPRGVATFAKSAYGVDMTVDDARDVIDIFHATYPDVLDWKLEQERQTRRDSYVQTLAGRRWYWAWRARKWDDPRIDELEDWQVDDWVAGYERNLALNYPVQGTAAEVMQVALAYLDQALRPYDARLLATVHDEVVLQVRDDPDTLRAVRRLLVTKMTTAWLEFFPTAPYRGIVEVGVGPTWADAH